MSNQVIADPIPTIYTPILDYSSPSTRNQWQIEKLKTIGVYNRIAAYGSREDWGRVSQIAPQEVSGGKLWRLDTGGEVEPGSVYWFVVVGDMVVVDAAGKWASHPCMEIYSPGAAKLYRDYAPLFRKWGGIPALRWQQFHESVASGMNVVDGVQAYGNPPLAVYGPDIAPPAGMSGLVPFPSDCALRRNPDTGAVELFKIQDFVRHYGNPIRYYAAEVPVLHSPLPVPPSIGLRGPLVEAKVGTVQDADSPYHPGSTRPETIRLNEGMVIDADARLHTSVLVDSTRYWIESPFELRVIGGKFGDGGVWERLEPSETTREIVLGLFSQVRQGVEISKDSAPGSFSYLVWTTADGRTIRRAISLMVMELAGAVIRTNTPRLNTPPEFEFSWPLWRLDEMAKKAEV